MHTYESLQIGDSFSLNRLVTAEDVQTFATLTGDDNPIHVDEAYSGKDPLRQANRPRRAPAWVYLEGART